MIPCEWYKDCPHPATHIDRRGWAYCTSHAATANRSGYPARKLRAWELRWLGEGKTLPSYEPGPEPTN